MQSVVVHMSRKRGRLSIDSDAEEHEHRKPLQRDRSKCVVCSTVTRKRETRRVSNGRLKGLNIIVQGVGSGYICDGCYKGEQLQGVKAVITENAEMEVELQSHITPNPIQEELENELLDRLLKGATHKSKGRPALYGMISVPSLLELLRIARKGCSSCSKGLYISKFEFIGFGIQTTLVCPDQHVCLWSSSKILPDASLSINREIICAAVLSGLEKTKYVEFFEAARIHCAESGYNKTASLFYEEVIQPAERELYESSCKSLQEEKEKVIGIDCQYSRSQRQTEYRTSKSGEVVVKGGPAPHCTCTVMNLTKGSENYGDILGQFHVSTSDLKDQDLKRTANKELLTTKAALTEIAKKVKDITRVVADGCTSLEWVVKECLGSKVEISTDTWHNGKNLCKAFIKLTSEKRPKTAEEKADAPFDRTRTVMKHPTLSNISKKQLKNHFYYSLTGLSNEQMVQRILQFRHHKCSYFQLLPLDLITLILRDLYPSIARRNGIDLELHHSRAGNVDAQKRVFIGAVDHWYETDSGAKYMMTPDDADVLEGFLERQSKKVEAASFNDNTSYIESFHRTRLRFYDKKLYYSNDGYRFRTAIAALAWSAREDNDHYSWRHKLIERFLDYLSTRIFNQKQITKKEYN